MGWNFGDILDAIEPVLPPDAPAFIHGERTVPWHEASRLSNNLARALIARGAAPGDKVAVYMRNRPEYMITLSAAFKARLTHVNVNYRYTPDEVWYIFDNSDAQTVVYASEFRDAVTQVRDRLPKVKTWVEVSEGGEPRRSLSRSTPSRTTVTVPRCSLNARDRICSSSTPAAPQACPKA